MNDTTSTTTTVSESEALDLVRQAAQRGRERLEASAAIAAQQRAEQAARDVERWRHVYHTLGLAEWMLPFVEQPEPQRRPDDCMVLLLNLPACAPIICARAHTAHLWSTATCAAMIPVSVEYDPDGDEWYVRRRQGPAYVPRLLDLAIAEAEHHAAAWTEMHLEATRRNDRGEQPAPRASAPVEIEMPDDPAAKVLAHIAELNYSTDDFGTALRGVLYGFITLALELRRNTETTRAELAAIRVAVEDLAAAALCDELADPSAEQDTDHVN